MHLANDRSDRRLYLPFKPLTFLLKYLPIPSATWDLFARDVCSRAFPDDVPGCVAMLQCDVLGMDICSCSGDSYATDEASNSVGSSCLSNMAVQPPALWFGAHAGQSLTIVPPFHLCFCYSGSPTKTSWGSPCLVHTLLFILFYSGRCSPTKCPCGHKIGPQDMGTLYCISLGQFYVRKRKAFPLLNKTEVCTKSEEALGRTLGLSYLSSCVFSYLRNHHGKTLRKGDWSLDGKSNPFVQS